MFKWFVVRRILRGLVVFSVIMLILSALFNTVNEKTAYSQIEEQIRAEVMALRDITGDELESFRRQRRQDLLSLYRLDRPLHERILSQAWRSITFNFGKAANLRAASGSSEVKAILAERIPRSFLLFTTASFLQLLIGVSLGLVKAQKAGGGLDKFTSLLTMAVYGMPSWWLAMLLIMLLVYTLPLFPSGGVQSVPPPEGFMLVINTLWHLALPLLTLLLIGVWSSAYLVRNIVLCIFHEDYIMALRARGIGERSVLYKHTLRSAAPPITTMVVLSLLVSIGGAIIFEGIFSWPGLGMLYWIAVQQNDIPVLMGNLTLTTALYQLGLVLLDISYGFLDPRIKVGGKM